MMGSNHFLIHRLEQLGNQWHQLHYLVRSGHLCIGVGTNPYCTEHLVSLVQLLRKHPRIHNHRDQFRHIGIISVQLGIVLGIRKQRYSILWFHLHLQIVLVFLHMKLQVCILKHLHILGIEFLLSILCNILDSYEKQIKIHLVCFRSLCSLHLQRGLYILFLGRKFHSYP